MDRVFMLLSDTKILTWPGADRGKSEGSSGFARHPGESRDAVTFAQSAGMQSRLVRISLRDGVCRTANANAEGAAQRERPWMARVFPDDERWD
jgi:hypothetical protein